MSKKTKAIAFAATLSLTGAIGTASAVSVVDNSAGGEVLIFPYFNVNNNFSTAFNITNTTKDYKAIKVRFRESKTSNDILDFNVYMSPEDVMTLTVANDDKGARLLTTDNTCTYPAIPASGVVFKDVYDSVSKDDMKEGYLEVIEMGVIEDATVKAGLLHDTSGDNAGKPADCSVIATAWNDGTFLQGGAASNLGVIHSVDPRNSYPNNAVGGSGVSDIGFYGLDPVKLTAAISAPKGGLVGTEILLNNGVDNFTVADFVAEPISIVNYSTVPQHYLSSDQNFYLLPSLASGNVMTSDGLSSDYTSVSRVTWSVVARDFGLDDTSTLPNDSPPSGINPMPMAHALAVAEISNQFVTGSTAATDWVVTNPMRKHGIFNDFQYVSGPAGYNSSNDIPVAGDEANGYWKYLTSGLTSDFTYYNREEASAKPSAPGDFSPPLQTGGASADLSREVNILSLSMKTGNYDPVLGSVTSRTLFLEDGFEAGWAKMDFSSYDLAGPRFNAWATATLTTPGTKTIGVPLIGFAAAHGDTANGRVGEVFNHSMKRVR